MTSLDTETDLGKIAHLDFEPPCEGLKEPWCSEHAEVKCLAPCGCIYLMCLEHSVRLKAFLKVKRNVFCKRCGERHLDTEAFKFRSL